MRYAGERAYIGEGDICASIKLGIIVGLLLGLIGWLITIPTGL